MRKKPKAKKKTPASPKPRCRFVGCAKLLDPVMVRAARARHQDPKWCNEACRAKARREKLRAVAA